MSFNFNENQVVDKIEAVPEEFRPFYKEADGKYKLDSETPAVAVAVANIGKLTKALQNERATKKVDLSALKDFGDDPETILANLNTKIEEAKASGSKGGEKALEALKQSMLDNHAKELEKERGEKSTMAEQLYDLTVVNAATSAIAAEKGTPELLMPFIKQQIKVITVDGKIVPRVVDASGEIRYSGATGDPMSIAELVKEMKANTKYARLFESEAGQGGGSRPGQSSKQPPQGNHKQTTFAKDKTSIDKISEGLKNRQKS